MNIRGGGYPQKNMEHGQFGIETPMGHSEWNIVIERDLHPGTSNYNWYVAISIGAWTNVVHRKWLYFKCWVTKHPLEHFKLVVWDRRWLWLFRCIFFDKSNDSLGKANVFQASFFRGKLAVKLRGYSIYRLPQREGGVPRKRNVGNCTRVSIKASN